MLFYKISFLSMKIIYLLFKFINKFCAAFVFS